jgi:two-component sensor histidine kinase
MARPEDLGIFVLQVPEVLAGGITALALLIAVASLIRMRGLGHQLRNSQKSESHFRESSNSSPDGFYILESVRDHEGTISDFRFAFVNWKGASLLSRTSDALTGELMSLALPSNMTNGLFEKYRLVASTGEPLSGDLSIGEVSGTASSLAYQAVRVDDGVALTVRNTSRQTESDRNVSRLESKLEGEEHLRRMIETAPSAMVIADSAGKLEMVNTGMEQTFGYPRYELLGMTIDTLVPDRFSGHGPISPGGTEFPIEISFNPFDTESGTKVLSAILDISDRKKKELRIQSDLKEKDVLLGEIHHRVKNNLQIVHSLLELQSAQISDPVVLAMLRDSQNRIRSMALIHQTLYQSKDFASVDFGMFLNSLVPTLIASYLENSERIVLKITALDMHLPINTAIPCGLLMNELISNSLKHAFPAQRRGKITINFVHEGPDFVVLTVCDDGVGIPEGLDIKQTSSLGLQLVFLLTDQIGGTMTVHRSDPTMFVLRFPLKEPTKYHASPAPDMTSVSRN